MKSENQAPATRETRGTARQPEDLARECVLQFLDTSSTMYAIAVPLVRIAIENAVAERVSQPVAPPPLDLLKKWWEIGKLFLKHAPVPEDEVATLMFETEIAAAACAPSAPAKEPGQE